MDCKKTAVLGMQGTGGGKAQSETRLDRPNYEGTVNDKLRNSAFILWSADIPKGP